MATQPSFLENDPFPTNPDRRPVSSGSATTDATSDLGVGDDFRSAKERQSNVPTLDTTEVGLPPSRPSSVGIAQAQRASVRSSMQPPLSRRGLAAFVTSPRGAVRSPEREQARPTSPLHTTHVPIVASGFANPMTGRQLQAQRGQRIGAVGASHEPGAERQTTGGASEEAERTTRPHRYSNASVNTLRDGLPPSNDDEVPPLPVSRGTDGTHDFNLAHSVASQTSTTPLNAAMRSQNSNNLTVQPNLPLSSGQKSPRSPSGRSLRTSLRLSSRTGSWQRRSEQHQQLHSDPSSPANGANEKAVLPPPAEPSKGEGKNYEYYAGNMLFFLSGRCLNTKAKPISILTFLLIVLPAAIFFGLEAPWLWHNVSPAIPIIFAYVFYLTVSSFIHASFSDPGILPRNVNPHPANPEEERDPLTVGPPTTEWVMVRTFDNASKPPSPANLEAGQAPNVGHAMEVPVKYCKSCTIWRPPRAHHCRICDACIETQDHHCVWLNNCVGRRNYRFFYTFISAASVLAILLLAFSAVHLSTYASQNNISFSGAITSGRAQERAALAMLIYAILAFPYPFSLWGYHVFLIARGETTREYLNSHKFLKKDRHRPFTLGSWVKNFVAVLIRPRPPQYLQFKLRYREGDLRYGFTQTKSQRKAEHRGKYSVEMAELPNGRSKKRKGKKEEEVQQQGFSGPVNNTPR